MAKKKMPLFLKKKGEKAEEKAEKKGGAKCPKCGHSY